LLDRTRAVLRLSRWVGSHFASNPPCFPPITIRGRPTDSFPRPPPLLLPFPLAQHSPSFPLSYFFIPVPAVAEQLSHFDLSPHQKGCLWGLKPARVFGFLVTPGSAVFFQRTAGFPSAPLSEVSPCAIGRPLESFEHSPHAPRSPRSRFFFFLKRRMDPPTPPLLPRGLFVYGNIRRCPIRRRGSGSS